MYEHMTSFSFMYVRGEFSFLMRVDVFLVSFPHFLVLSPLVVALSVSTHRRFHQLSPRPIFWRLLLLPRDLNRDTGWRFLASVRSSQGTSPREMTASRMLIRVRQMPLSRYLAKCIYIFIRVYTHIICVMYISYQRSIYLINGKGNKILCNLI